MGWQNRMISPTLEKPPKVHIRYPCPGLCRFTGMVSFLVVSLCVFYGGIKAFGLETLDWSAPVWTGKHVALFATAVLLGGLASLLGFGLAMTIELRNDRLNDLFIVLWQFLANGCLLWVFTLGIAMTLALGREEAKVAVLHFGAERATIHVLGAGGVVGLLSGATFYFAPIIRLPLFPYLAFSVGVSLVAARWHFTVYSIEGRWWIVAGLLVPILLLLLAPSMIERDRRQRRLLMEQSS